MHTDPYAQRETARYAVARDEIEHFWSDDYNKCLVWMQGHVPYSWHHAFTYEGWKIVDRRKPCPI